MYYIHTLSCMSVLAPDSIRSVATSISLDIVASINAVCPLCMEIDNYSTTIQQTHIIVRYMIATLS